MDEVLPMFPPENFCLPGNIPAYNVGPHKVTKLSIVVQMFSFIIIQQICSRRQGAVLYYSQTVLDAIGNLSEVITGGGELMATNPTPSSALQAMVGW